MSCLGTVHSPVCATALAETVVSTRESMRCSQPARLPSTANRRVRRTRIRSPAPWSTPVRDVRDDVLHTLTSLSELTDDPRTVAGTRRPLQTPSLFSEGEGP